MVGVPQKRFVNIQELSEYLGVKISTVYSWVFQRKIPHIKMWRLLKFDMHEIEKWIEIRRIKESEIYTC